MRFTTLNDWLDWQETLHPSEIELGLERVKTVFQSLHPQKTPFTVITVAGTNGKGSSVAMLESMLLAAGFSVGSYTSPHIHRYNERIRLGAQMVEDSLLIESFERIDQARGEISLTYFEFATLAALDIFFNARPEVVVLEVGLGGRLDAVNIIDPDIALITSIGIDHTAWLGDNRETIAQEKAGIMRHEIPVVFSGREIPDTIRQVAVEHAAKLTVLDEDYHYNNSSPGWVWEDNKQHTIALPLPMLLGAHQLQNAAGVIQVLKCLQHILPVNNQSIRAGLLNIHLRGRFQVVAAVDDMAETVFDVAHNPQAMQQLANTLVARPAQGKTHCVIAMLADKDCAKAVQPLLPIIDTWYCGNLHIQRGLSETRLAAHLLHTLDASRVKTFDSIEEAYQAARVHSGSEDRIVVCGSFITVAEVLKEYV